ncbi:heterodimeric methylmalonyl-CoA mutase small subunit [Austwickia chelonae]|uniref:Methylmalonyl-CoA mutase small subunit n=1 Tax=Austwickia chelonae NBRC 105200 TaxID=1184607 RepID=K6W7U7_9MICO|nr:methylmalonyl-CoA mutase small subunit [Austwickia chelonae]GAB77912.1 methylmalonyl-CoA mutase small subunit [Austwickia chelonae NBRC 105200]SEV92090.1 heterodimeric methylmalonyl-CoA mutase small subunit [Austwickia chelonae]
MTSVDETFLPLADGFDTLSHDQWQGLVAKVLNRGRPEDKRLDGATAEARLHTTTVDGIGIPCLYEAGDEPSALGHPGVMPFTRGSGYRPADVPWGVRSLHDDPDAAVTRKAVMTDLERGATSLWFEIGEHAVHAEDLGSVLEDVLLDLAPVCVTSATDQEAAAQALRDVWRQRGLVTRQARGNLGLDPLGAAARTGEEPRTEPMVAAVRDCLTDYPQVRAISVDMRPYHDAGAGDVDEIAFAVATGVDYLRILAEAGISPAEAFSQIEFRLNATADEFLTIAKMRAMRRAWARVGEECGVPEKERGARLHVVTSWRMMSRDDPYVNMLRTTMACFGAAVGAAEAITVLPFDTVAGLPDEFSRRIARNTQVLLAEESNVGRVLDPAGGSWYVEQLTEEMSQKAWAAFQEVEAAGGMTRALADLLVRERIGATVAERAKRLAKRQLPLTGVSMFPQVAEKPVVRRPRAAVPTPSGGLEAHRDSEIFEALRDRSLAHEQATGSAPPVFLACLGARRDFGARETFTSALLAVGGLATPRSEGGTPEEIAAQAKEIGARVAVLCSSADRYAEQGVAVAEALRAAGVDKIYIAGRPAELGDGADAVDDSIFAGMDVVTALSSILDLIGAPATVSADATRKDR